MNMRRIAFAYAAVLMPAVALFAGANRVNNGDFESFRTDGWVEGWRCGRRETWTVAKGAGKDGSTALVWECRDAKAPKGNIVREITLKPGKMYLIEADIFVEGVLKGPYGKGAFVYFERFAADGKRLGGTYTEEVKSSSGGWLRASTVSSPINAKTTRVVAGVQVTKGCTGKVRFDNFCIREFDVNSAPDPSSHLYRYSTDRANTNRCVWIDAERRTRVCGKPFFPLGTYGGLAE